MPLAARSKKSRQLVFQELQTGLYFADLFFLLDKRVKVFLILHYCGSSCDCVSLRTIFQLDESTSVTVWHPEFFRVEIYR
jgi:hypothetical protein